MTLLRKKWKKGDEKQYKIVTNKFSIKDNVKEVQNSRTKIIEIEILKDSELDSIVDWTEYYPPKSWFQKMLQRTLGIYTNFSIDFNYKTDAYGALEEFIMDESLEGRLKLIQEEIKGNVNEGEKLNRFLTEEFILKKITRGITLFHIPYGIEFSRDVFEENTEFHNLVFEDLGMPGEINYSLIYFDENSSIGEVELEKKYNQLELKEKLGESLSRFNVWNEDEITTKIPPLAITERYWYKLNFSTGWIVQAKYERGILTKEKDNILEINFECLN